MKSQQLETTRALRLCAIAVQFSRSISEFFYFLNTLYFTMQYKARKASFIPIFLPSS